MESQFIVVEKALALLHATNSVHRRLVRIGDRRVSLALTTHGCNVGISKVVLGTVSTADLVDMIMRRSSGCGFIRQIVGQNPCFLSTIIRCQRNLSTFSIQIYKDKHKFSLHTNR